MQRPYWLGCGSRPSRWSSPNVAVPPRSWWSPESYERSEHERQILRLLARGEREIAKGKGYDLDTVLAEADESLAERS